MHTFPTLSDIRAATLILLAPLLECLALRLFLHYGLKLSIGWGGLLTDYDLLLPAPIASIILFSLLQHVRPHQLELRFKTLSLNIVALTIFLGLNLHYDLLRSTFGVGFLSVWWGVLFLTVLSAFFLWVPMSFVVRNPSRWVLFPCLLMAFSVVIYQHSFETLWLVFRAPLSASIDGVLSTILGDRITTQLIDPHGYLLVRHPVLPILIGKGCGGIDSFLLFLCVSSLFFGLARSALSTSQWVAFVLGGVLWTFFLNVLRICALFLSGIFLFKNLPREMATFLVFKFFHVHLGWVIYLAGLELYFGLWLAFASHLRLNAITERIKAIGKRVKAQGIPSLGISGTPIEPHAEPLQRQ